MAESEHDRNLETGWIFAEYEVGRAVSEIAAELGKEVVYQSAEDKGVYAVDKQTGRSVWRGGGAGEADDVGESVRIWQIFFKSRGRVRALHGAARRGVAVM